MKGVGFFYHKYKLRIVFVSSLVLSQLLVYSILKIVRHTMSQLATNEV